MNRFAYRILGILLFSGTITLLYIGNIMSLKMSKSTITQTLGSHDKHRSSRSDSNSDSIQNHLNVIQHDDQPSSKRGEGKFSGSPGQHKYFYTKVRDWFIDPQIEHKLCRPTKYTQCSPPTKRTKQQKDADRVGRGKPFKVTVFRPFTPDPRTPDFSQCEYDNCVYAGTQVTPETDAVYIYGAPLPEDVPLPALRLPHQVFIFATSESPIHTFRFRYLEPNSKWIQYFNATMTYRKNADIFKPYGILDFQPKPPHLLPNYREIARKKTRSIVWLVSNCETQSNRRQYVRELQKYIAVDIFGLCGQKCEVKDERCVLDISDTYRFYLSFENSFSTDYVTEKFFKLFIDDMHVVPIVRSSFDYDKEFPEKSMINTANFKGPKELAAFLMSLEADEEEYVRYLEVKDKYRALHQLNHWCTICEYLHKWEQLPESRRTKVVHLRKELYDGHTQPPPPLII